MKGDHKTWVLLYFVSFFLFTKGLLNPLDCPHHMRVSDRLPYREGVVVNRPVKNGKGSLVNVGLGREVSVDKHLKPGTRVTVKISYGSEEGKNSK